MKAKVFFAMSTVAVACSTMAVVAPPRPKALSADATNRMDAARMEAVKEAIARRDRQTGGTLVRPGSGGGRIAFVNCQERFAQNALEDIAQQLGRMSRLNIVSVKGKKNLVPSSVRKEHGAEVSVMLVDKPDEPLMLLAPEDGWGMVNVARIADGEKFNAGCCKALLRTFGLLCGGGISMQQGNILSEVKLEKTYDLQNTLPQDVTMRQLKYLADMGVKPQSRTTYRKACEEGWAPAPTNEVQKAIWDKVHEMPTEPIKIKPETKKVKE